MILFGPAAEMEAAEGVEIVDAPVSIAKAADPARAVRTTPDASVVQAVEAVASGRADALVSGGSTGTALAGSLFRFKRAPGVHRPALAIVVPVPGAPFLLLDAGANVAVRPEHLVQFAHMGAAFMEVVMGVRRPRVALLSNGEEPSKGPEDVVAAHAVLSESPGEIEFVGNVEGFAIGKGVADVLVADGYAGNVALKVMEGTSDVLLRSVRDGRDVLAALQARRAAAAAGAARAARRDRPGGARRGRPARAAAARRRAARVLRRARVRERDRGGRARRPRGHPRAHARALARRRAAAREAKPARRKPVARPPAETGSEARQTVRCRRYGARSAMTRDEVLQLIRSHLADELQIEPDRIAEETHFKQDLDADSLDLYTLVVEFEDAYGVKMSDEQAARIQTVGQAVDFVLEHLPQASSSS